MKKTLLTILCTIIACSCVMGATLAYLKAETATVKNTFTIGSITISLAESTEDGSGETLSRTFRMSPGATITKDPKVTVKKDSEACWLFVKLVNPLEGIIASKTLTEQMQDNGWTIIDATNNIWAKTSKAIAGVDVKIFEYFTIKGDVALAASYADITVQAYAVQADTFNSYTDAWAAAPLAAWLP